MQQSRRLRQREWVSFDNVEEDKKQRSLEEFEEEGNENKKN